VSSLEQLVRELCPEGVPYIALDELLDYEQPGKYLVSSTAYDPKNAIPVLTAGKTFILGYTDETDGIFPASPTDPVIIFDDFTTAFKWVDFPFKAKSSAMKMLRLKPMSPVDLRFAWYAMLCIRFKPASQSRHWISKYSAFRIPVPPMEVQKEVLRTLDSFRALEAELEAELNVELRSRRRHYLHVRDQLLSFPPDGNVPRRSLAQLGQLVRGNGMPKTVFTASGVGAIHYGQIYTRYGTWTDETISYVSPETASKLAKVAPGDIIITNTSENLEDVGKAVAWLGDEEIVTGGHATVLKHDQDPKFVAYWFQSPDFFNQKKKLASGTKVIDVSATSLGTILMPLPSLEEQSRIASVLDELAELTGDLSAELTREVVARRQQYEYFRDRLMTFEGLPV
jgi:type I restriction enzyme S subunit